MISGVGTGIHELRPRTVAPQHTERTRAVASRGPNVVLAVTDHQAIRALESLLGKKMREEIGLVVESTIKRRAIDPGQEIPKPEMRDDFLREVLGLGRAQKHRRSCAGGSCKHVRHARVDRVFAPAQFREPLAVERHRPFGGCRIVVADQARERFAKRRPDAGTQCIGTRIGQIHARQCVPDTVGDAFEIVGKRAVEVEEKRGGSRTVHFDAVPRLRTMRYSMMAPSRPASHIMQYSWAINGRNVASSIVTLSFATGMITVFPSW